MKSNKSELTRYRQYESEKRKLRGLSPKEYEQAVRRLAEKYGI